MYDIRSCRLDEVELLETFIDRKWRTGHSLSKNRALLDWQHLDSRGEKYNFLIAKHEGTGSIDAVLGFIPTRQFDRTLLAEGDYWGAIWKIDETVEAARGLGHLLFQKLLSLPELKSFGALGISDDTARYMSILKFSAATMDQHYILNEQCREFRIATTEHATRASRHRNDPTELTEVNDLSEMGSIQAAYRPKKSIRYIENRYARHPVYHYRFLALHRESHPFALIVARKVKSQGSSCLRIVDVLGDLSASGCLYDSVQELLQRENAEYLDCVSSGIGDDAFERMSFQKLARDGDVIIPNFFEPFERKNITIRCAWRSEQEPYVLVKGDSDQDRPNQLQAAGQPDDR